MAFALLLQRGRAMAKIPAIAEVTITPALIAVVKNLGKKG